MGQTSLTGLGAYTTAAQLSNGDIILVSSTDSQYAYAQRLDANFNKLGTSYKVSTSIFASSNPYNFSVSDLADGGYVVMWEGNNIAFDASGTCLLGQRVDASGNKVGTEFLVNTITSGNQKLSSIDSFSDGGFVAVWLSSSGTSDGAYFQRFNSVFLFIEE